MTDKLKLLPCPFCGRSAKIHSWWSSRDECGKAFVACNTESYANGYECAVIHIERVDEKTAREDAAAAWNRRAFGLEIAGLEIRLEGDTLYLDGLGTFKRVSE